ncbi:hypothetical protein CEF21_21470 [Bacillus sp. FJAT-42376]|uniref:hypothetical protein n=1 Tax=Bacillus sp. FJAT-42376 TaxID=2014076 RepID=UPI000F516A78|nr:hypothetical protein [Bacillus sp. FJAT-42376]AZB44651.1 hypothetical protein CEF21_21470 [Bacillus sp. FJAT-42376]
MSVTLNEQGQNISAAVEVLLETYKNLEIFFSELDRVGEEEGFVTLTPRFMRWKSDTDYTGWLIQDFLKLYQLEADPVSETFPDLRIGNLFGVEVRLNEKYPVLSLIRYDVDYSHWTRMPAVSDHWVFYGPFKYENFFDINKVGNRWTSTTREKGIKRHWGIKRAIAVDLQLVDVKSVQDIRLQVLEKLKELTFD